MARNAGRYGRMYFNITSAGTAEPAVYIRQWGFNAATDKIEVTAQGDVNKVYVAGLPDFSGDLSGFYDDATAQMWTAAIEGVARKMYIYPTSSTSTYWFGTGLLDFNLSEAVDGAVEITASWAAATAFTKVG